MAAFEGLADENVAYLRTTGRRSGKPHTTPIWFALDGLAVYLLSGGGENADWVKNLRRDPRVRVRIGSRSIAGRARVDLPADEDAKARRLLDGKYMDWRDGRPLSSWARNALPVAIDI